MPPNFAKRVMKDYKDFSTNLPQFAKGIYLDEDDLTQIYFYFEGPSDSDYQGGEYIMKFVLTKEYPLTPPDFIFLTPNGRFDINKKICTSFTGFHKESWSPCYNFNTLFTSIISFMLDENLGHVGSVKCSKEGREKFAINSKEYNEKHHLRKMFEK